MSQVIPGWYNTAAAREILNVSGAAISKISKAEGWQSVSMGPGNGHLHPVADVHEYRDHQLRTELVKALGWKGRGLYRIDDIDISCPVCDSYAIEWPAPPYLAEKYLCLKGHKGEVQLCQ